MACCSGVISGGNVWMAPLIVRVAERSGRSWRRRLQVARPVLVWARGDGQGGEDDGQVRFDGRFRVVEHGSGGEVGLDMRKDCSYGPPAVLGTVDSSSGTSCG